MDRVACSEGGTSEWLLGRGGGGGGGVRLLVGSLVAVVVVQHLSMGSRSESSATLGSAANR